MQRQQDLLISLKETSSEPLIFHLDATGSVIRHGTNTYLYSMCAKVPLHKIKALPLVEWLSESHSSSTISSSLQFWREKIEDLYEAPEYFVTDFSWAMLHGIAQSLIQLPLNVVLLQQWQALIGMRSSDLSTFLRLCCNHFIHALCRRLKNKPIGKEVVHFTFLISYYSRQFRLKSYSNSLLVQ